MTDKEENTSGQQCCEDVVMDQEWPDNEGSHELMKCVLDHYLKHHKVVLRKLELAQEATAHTIKEIDQICEHFDSDNPPETFTNLKAFDEQWQDSIKLFLSISLSETELEEIEQILDMIPKTIKANYERLIEGEKALQKLISELHSDEYKQALNQIKNIQERLNPMSNLGPEEYDAIPEPADDKGVETAYIFNQPETTKRKQR